MTASFIKMDRTIPPIFQNNNFLGELELSIAEESDNFYINKLKD